MDAGDFVIIIHAEKVALTGSKLEKKRAYRHSGYPGGLKSSSYAELLEKHPVRAVEKAIRGMLPKNKLAAQQMSKLGLRRPGAPPRCPAAADLRVHPGRPVTGPTTETSEENRGSEY